MNNWIRGLETYISASTEMNHTLENIQILERKITDNGNKTDKQSENVPT